MARDRGGIRGGWAVVLPEVGSGVGVLPEEQAERLLSFELSGKLLGSEQSGTLSRAEWDRR